MTNNIGMIVKRVIIMAVAIDVFVVRARIIDECRNVTQDGYIDNTRENCIYAKIYCSGNDSVFCDAVDLCDDLYDCAAASTTSGTSTPRATIETTSYSSSSGKDTLLTTTTPSTSSTVQDVRHICVQGVTRKFAYPHNCNYFYYCVDGFLLVEQCPLGYAFDEQSAKCSGRIIDVPGCMLR